MPKIPHRLPQDVLSSDEAELVMQQPDITTSAGLRDRAILETLYSTGVRRQEVVSIRVEDVNFSQGTLLVRQGKGNKQRVVPISERALYWIQEYLQHVRPSLSNDEQGTLFLTATSRPLTLANIGNRVTQYIQRSEIGKKGSCHLFRHTMATLMLSNGADVRYISEILGHAEISTTEVYTRVTISKLKEIHRLTHPAKMHPTKTQEILKEIEDPSD